MSRGIVYSLLAGTLPLLLAAGCGSGEQGRVQDPSFAKVDLANHRPKIGPRAGVVTSENCRECHARQHETWHHSWHRSMTQEVNPDTVFGDFDNAVFTNHVSGCVYRMHRHDDRYWVEFLNPGIDMPEGFGGQEMPLVLATGSHHMQMYWFPTMNGRTLGLVPVAYLKEDQRWVPRDAAFLKPRPHGDMLEIGRWNLICVRCHGTHGTIDMDPDNLDYFDTAVAELGIACEACHGPGGEHVRLHRAAGDAPVDPDPIVNPAELDPSLSGQVCGGCHSITQVDYLAGWKPHQAGQAIGGSTTLIRRDEASRDYLMQVENKTEAQVLELFDHYFWRDGMVRVSGREYNGLIHSPCHQRGAMSCLSCHEMHPGASDPRPLKEWADDQLSLKGQGDGACLQCHEPEYARETHTHHPPASSGSRCYNCHMPHTSYGLLKAIRSHTVDSPSARNSLETGRPNACNLCHLDRTLAWTAEKLGGWYGQEEPALPAEHRDVAASAVWALRGDAGQRALIAWHLGWPEAVEVSGKDWIPPYLAQLLGDSYDAVRYIAARSLRRFPGYGDFSYDFVGPEPQRALASQQAFAIWDAQKPAQFPVEKAATLIFPDGRPDRERMLQLLQAQDQRPVSLSE